MSVNFAAGDFEAVVFDMDGIIFDTERLVQDCWQIIADRDGIPEIRKTCTSCLGMNFPSVVKIFKARYGEDFPFSEYQVEVRKLFFGEKYGEHLPIKKGAEHLLQALKAAHVPVALATSTGKEAVIRELTDAGLIQYFDHIVCGDMVTQSKPHPEIFLKACELLGASPEASFAIEDSYNGIRAAHAGGLRPIMVPDLLPPIPEIEAMTELICPSLDEVCTYILG